MKINTKLIIAVFVPLILVLVVGVMVIFSFFTMEASWDNGNRVRLIRNSITDLNHLVFSYVTYREERPKQQFLAEHKKITTLLAGEHFGDPNQQQLLNEIRINIQSIKDAFIRLVSSTELSAAAESNKLNREAEEELAGQLLIRSHDADSIASTLKGMVDKDIKKTQTKTLVLIFLIISFASIPFIFILAQTRKRITTDLTNLHHGTELIGSGNLDQVIPVHSNDEIGQLTQAFNRMTASLKNVTASKAELESEMAERKRAEEALKRAHDELDVRVQERTAELSATITRLEQLNREMEEFAFIASHDLQEPLRKIETFSDLAKKRYVSIADETGQDYLDRIQKSASRMRLLINDLLKLSRVTTKIKPFQGINLVNLVKEVADIFEPAIKETGGRIVIDKMPIVEADEGQLRQLFQNLIGNALKFRDNKNSLVRVYGQAADHGFCEILVKDNGIGFNMEYAERIFQPFERLHCRSAYEGTGMGLTICRRIVERHGGTIKAESEPGKGSTFIIKLPLKQTKEEGAYWQKRTSLLS
jgi:signal transduction histidine kinase